VIITKLWGGRGARYASVLGQAIVVIRGTMARGDADALAVRQQLPAFMVRHA
jgi:hypothetical protein